MLIHIIITGIDKRNPNLFIQNKHAMIRMFQTDEDYIETARIATSQI